MNGCVFCDSIAGRAEVSLVHEDAETVAFLDIRPINPGHLLVVPKRHAPFLADLDPTLGGHLFQVALRMEQAIRRSGVRCEGINLFLADGEAAGQEIFHVHLHVFPRFRGDGFRIVDDCPTTPPRAELDELAVRLRHAVSGGPASK